MSRRSRGSVQRRGNGRWYVRVSHEGRRTTRGSWATRAEAEAQIPTILAEIGRAEVVRQERQLGQWIDEYEPVLRSRVAEGTARNAMGHLRAAALWLAQHRGCWMREVTRADVEEYTVDLLEDRRSSTVRRHLDDLAVAWDAALERGYVDSVPWRGVPLQRAQERAVPWVAPSDVARLVSRVRLRHRDLVQLLVETGLRKGEGYGLEWPDVDLDRGKLLVRRAKSRRLREVPLMPGTLAMLAARREARTVIPAHGPDLVFAGLPCAEILRQDLDEACKLARIPRLRVHDLRHVYASHCVQAGVPIPTVAALLGHQDGGALVLRRYGRWGPDDAGAQAVAALAAMRGGARTKSRARPG